MSDVEVETYTQTLLDYPFTHLQKIHVMPKRRIVMLELMLLRNLFC